MCVGVVRLIVDICVYCSIWYFGFIVGFCCGKCNGLLWVGISFVLI